MKYTYLLGLLAFLFFAACEDLEDTYDDYVGDGPVRYLAKCADVTVESGWERLIVEWKNDLDPNREGVWIRCASDSYQRDTLVAADCDSCSFNGLVDGSYTVTVAAVTHTGDTSLTVIGSGRPYTPTHEAVMSFTRGITKYFFVKDNLVLFALGKTPEIVDFKLHYTRKSDGQPAVYNLSGNMWFYNARDLLVQDVDASQPVILLREGLLSECPDTIPFPEYVLEPTIVNMNADFQNCLVERYGPEIDFSREELELDYNLNSLEDILYFPNLKKLVLGQNRYYDGANSYNAPSTINYAMATRMQFCVRTIHTINPEFEIENYGNCYSINPYTFVADGINVEEKGIQTTLPAELTLLDTTGFVVKADTVTVDNKLLLDNDPTTVWEPLQAQSTRTHDLVIDLGENKTVKGVLITQVRTSSNAQHYMPESVTVNVSEDGITWTNPCYLEGLTLGGSPGERKLVDFAEEQNVRYIRVSVQDVNYGNNYSCALGDVLPY